MPPIQMNDNQEEFKVFKMFKQTYGKAYVEFVTRKTKLRDHTDVYSKVSMQLTILSNRSVKQSNFDIEFGKYNIYLSYRDYLDGKAIFLNREEDGTFIIPGTAQYTTLDECASDTFVSYDYICGKLPIVKSIVEALNIWSQSMSEIDMTVAVPGMLGVHENNQK